MTDASIDWEQQEERLATRALATGWFDELYQAGASGKVQLPWSRLNPHPLLVDWAHARGLTGHGRRAAVVGCGLGADAEYLAALDFDTTGFDISATAIDLAAQRFPGTTVHYEAADLLQLPRRWLSAFDLVVEIITCKLCPIDCTRKHNWICRTAGRHVAVRAKVQTTSDIRADDLEHRQSDLAPMRGGPVRPAR